MSDNKVNGKKDFSNVKQTQLDSGQTLKGSFSELQSALRTYSTNSILREGYTHFIQTLDGNNLPTNVEYWQATSTAKDRLTVVADSAGDLAGKYFALQEYLTKKVHVFYYVVSGGGSAPGVGDIETAINIVTNDSAALVARATNTVINATEDFTSVQPSLLAGNLEIEYFQFGETDAINVATSGFTTDRLTSGTSYKVGEVSLSYNASGDTIYNGNVLKGLTFNVFTASMELEKTVVDVSIQEGLDIEDEKKAAILEASDVIKTLTYVEIDGEDYISNIEFSSSKVNTYYTETITLDRSITYVGLTSNINSVSDTLTIV